MLPRLLSCYVAASTFNAFPEIPLTLGIRHIHTPEQCIVAHGLALPGVKISETTPPVRVKDYTLISFRIGATQTARMFTDDSCKSHLLLQEGEGERAYMFATLTVQAIGNLGHSVRLHTTLMRKPSDLERLVCTSSRDSVFRAIVRGRIIQDSDDNLAEYRRMVLAKDGQAEEDEPESP
jgi:hypothetical protein